MPSSEGAAWSRVLSLGGVLLAVILAIVAARVVWYDAYWLFRDDPPWRLETGGENRLLDRQTRRAKTLQGLTRAYRIALIGSSTVYHGLDPADVDPTQGAAYNLGISALMADELPTVAQLVASRSGVSRVMIGLDYYMFSRRTPGPHVNRALEEPIGRLDALIGSVVSRYALFDSWLPEVAGGADPGSWTRDSFRRTPPLSPALALSNDAARRRTTSSYVPDRSAFLSSALEALEGRDVTVYLSPVSPAQLGVMRDLRLLDDFTRWRADMAKLARSRGVRFADLADLEAGAAFDPEHGSTETWLDNLHFTPVLGRKVLAKLRLRDGLAP